MRGLYLDDDTNDVMQAPPTPARLRRSSHLSWFAHMGAVYLFHDLYGYLMEMSPDIVELIEAFAGGAESQRTIEAFRSRLDADPQELIDVLVAHAVLVEPDDDEPAILSAFVPIKARWNIWQRRDDRLVLWTAWGDRPVQEVFLSPDETRMWDAFDGEKRIAELRTKFDADRLLALVRRLVHSDVQALKMSLMPWSTYAKRPGLAPAYLASTMPYPAWKPGTPVPPAVALTDYHVHDIANAEEQFEHRETTLSHLFRIPHPALAGRSYSQALIDALIARGGLPERRIRVLELGGGLGYVAHDAIARLRGAGREVDYTIVELSPVLADAQRKRLAGVPGVTWVVGDVLAIDLPAGGFDLVIANEMVGDLPATQASRADVGLALDGTGNADRDKLRELSAIAADTGVNIDDAPEPFYLQVGALDAVARIARWLAPGGHAAITEFGDANAWPRLSTHLDHPELSTHFGQLAQCARGSGLTADIVFVIDLLDLDRTQTGMATTRSQFRALRALATEAGVELAKIGYTRELFERAIAGKLDLATIGDLRWDRIEDRLMGLVPHEFRALLLAKPQPSATQRY
jgi:SAM-dependent methyltransferase